MGEELTVLAIFIYGSVVLALHAALAVWWLMDKVGNFLGGAAAWALRALGRWGWRR